VTHQPTSKSGQSVQALNVNSLPLDNMVRVATVVQQVMKQFKGDVSEEAKIVAIAKKKNSLKSNEAKCPLEQMSLKVIAGQMYIAFLVTELNIKLLL
jgi:hypothetical protein